jgi:hypothetical protein
MLRHWRKLFHAEVPDVPEPTKTTLVLNHGVLALIEHRTDRNLSTTLGQILALVPAPVLVARFLPRSRLLGDEFS